MTATPFTSLLVANRGEIALRIMRSARDMGLKCVAVYTDADADAPHVSFADQAVNIGRGPAADSYLSIDKILDAARQSGAQAVHPGYGFLSENAAFAQACRDADLVFVGPSASAIEQMGNKATAKHLMTAAGVPCVPGYDGDDQSDDTLTGQAAKIGFPVMIKAAAGGGGRGMRLVSEPARFTDALHLARAEARSAFGSGQIILEQAVLCPRHVEIQILADRHGNTVHLGERDCSVQRRHQKIIEESPCPVLTPELRDKMGQAAVQAARAVGYEGAGTVEFLLDQNGGFYFLEMNTRLQVEHPVTELVTGLDIVALQLSIARGNPLGCAQQDVSLSVHAIEARLYAEDPARDFLPAAGDIVLWRPACADGVRVDGGIATGQTVSPFYDPMLAKIIAHGADREQARERLILALRETVVFGVPTNRDFLIRVLGNKTFADGATTTAFLAEEFAGTAEPDLTLSFQDVALAATLAYRALQLGAVQSAGHVPTALLGWGSPGRLTAPLRLAQGDREYPLRITDSGDGSLLIADGDNSARVCGHERELRIDGQRCDLRESLYVNGTIHVATGNRCFSMVHRRSSAAVHTKGSNGRITAPMHGNLLQLLVRTGDAVRPGSRLAVLEVMKMQHEILADVAGVVRSVPVTAPSQIRAGDLLVEIDVAVPVAIPVAVPDV